MGEDFDQPNLKSELPEMIPNQGTEIDNIMSQMEFEMGSLDFSDVKFLEMPVESDEDEEKEIDMIDRDRSDESDKHSNEKYLEFDEYQSMIPKLNEQEFTFSGGIAHTLNMIDNIGDPSMKIIESFYTSKTLLIQCTTREKVGILYKCNDILMSVNHISDSELFLTLTLMKDVLDTMTGRDEWTISEDYVIKNTGVDDSFQIYSKHIGHLELPDLKAFKDKGGIIKKGEENNTYYIPLKKERLLEVLEMTSNSITIDKFITTKPLEECYYRLYTEPFKRHGFASRLINELFD
jgi:hypothetical protein